MRLDRWFRQHFPDVDHGYLQKLLRSGQVRVDSKRVEANERLEAGAKVRVPQIVRDPREGAPQAGSGAPRSPRPTAMLIERMILYEDDDVLVLNKPFGMAVQGGTGTRAPPRRHARRHGRPLRRPAPPRAPPRPRHDGRAARRQAPRRGGQARAHLPDALGGQDLLGARQGRAAARRRARSRPRSSRPPGPTATACARRVPASRRRPCTRRRTIRSSTASRTRRRGCP